MRPLDQISRNPRLKKTKNHYFSNLRTYEMRTHSGVVLCMAGLNEDGWEHVSVSPKGSKDEREQPCPTWEQMCEVKRACWRDDESVVQFHPTEDNYLHGLVFEDTNILHLWRPVDGDWSILNKGITA